MALGSKEEEGDQHIIVVEERSSLTRVEEFKVQEWNLHSINLHPTYTKQRLDQDLIRRSKLIVEDNLVNIRH